MNARTLRIIAAVVVVMALIVFFMDTTDESDTTGAGETLLPDLKSQINSVSKVSIAMPDGGETLTLFNDGATWVVPEKGDYPADVGKIREVLLAIADAKGIERKTSNPERYEQIGVHDDGTRMSIEGDGFSYGLVVGNVAQSRYRYVRVADQEQSWLIDKNPDLPDNAGGWLNSDLIDIDAARVRSVTITHSDGESIHISKADAEESNFTVDEIPDGRELSYPSVANGIGGALNDLKLDDVRKGTPADGAVLAVLETFDGLQVTVQSEKTDGTTWIAFNATASDDAEEGIADEAQTINASTSGWQYQVPGYKADLLARRWDDILKAPETEEQP
jgi:hypothetical protein